MAACATLYVVTDTVDPVVFDHGESIVAEPAGVQSRLTLTVLLESDGGLAELVHVNHPRITHAEIAPLHQQHHTTPYENHR